MKTTFFDVPQDSPVERERKAGNCGNGKWDGFDVVYLRLQRVAERLGKGRTPSRLIHASCPPPSQDHVDVMAAMGSGHEGRMKEWVMYAIGRGWLTADDLNETGRLARSLA